jgi:hypothetical protein
MIFSKTVLVLMPMIAHCISAAMTTVTRGEHHRSMMVKTLERNARSIFLDDSGRRIQQNVFDDNESICDYVESSMGTDFLVGEAEGTCNCSGDPSETLEITCSMEKICDPTATTDAEPICGSMEFVVSIKGLLNENGDDLGANPSMAVSVCVDIDLVWLEEMCFTLNYDGTDMLVPTECGFTYGNENCICIVDTLALETDPAFDVDIPCFTWDCREVVPDPLVEYMFFSTCDGLPEGGAQGNITDSFPIFDGGVPPEVAREMEAYYAENGGSSAATNTVPFAALVWLVLAMLA